MEICSTDSAELEVSKHWGQIGCYYPDWRRTSESNWNLHSSFPHRVTKTDELPHHPLFLQPHTVLTSSLWPGVKTAEQHGPHCCWAWSGFVWHPSTCQLSLPTKLCSRLNPASNALTGLGVGDLTLKHTHTHRYYSINAITKVYSTNLSYLFLWDGCSFFERSALINVRGKINCLYKMNLENTEWKQLVLKYMKK